MKPSRAVYDTPSWRRARLAALKRARWQCEACGWPGRPVRSAGRLEVHHKRPLREIRGLARMTAAELAAAGVYDLDGLVVLCKGCHRARHRRREYQRRENQRRRAELPAGYAAWQARIRETNQREGIK